MRSCPVYKNWLRLLFPKKFQVMSAHSYKNKAKGPNTPAVGGQNVAPILGKPHKIQADMKFEVLATPVKSLSDKKEYKVIRLANGLTACLISDGSPIDHNDEGETTSEEGESESESEGSTTYSSNESGEEEEDSFAEVDDKKTKPAVRDQKMAAAALCVGVGSFSDPRDIPGLAHFLEHMVFMGSEKFPGENDFDSFITRKGGSDNASTDCEMTTFYFECLEKHFNVALDKFAQFFIAPLMKRNAMTREREAIESEFKMSYLDDESRVEQLLLSLSRKDCPVNSFTWGNLITLRDNVDDDKLYEAVHEFRKRHYSAHRMTLAVQARLPMEALESYVLDCFGDVPNNGLPPDDSKSFVDVFDTPEFNRIYYLKPSHNINQVELTWALPSLVHKYKSKPHEYSAWLVGNEGTGSLLAYLRRKVWALGMTVVNDETGSEHNSIYTLFNMKITLTREGLKHLFEVIELAFAYIHFLREVGPQKQIYDETKTIEDISFKYQVEESAADFVEGLVENMQVFPPEDYLTGADQFFEYDPEGIQQLIDSLTPQKVNVMVCSVNPPENITYTKTEKWFGTQYIDKEIPEEWLQRWESAKPLPEFALPPTNEFIPTDFTILSEDDNHPEYPKLLTRSNLGELFYRKDQKFKLPVAYYYVYFINPIATTTTKSYCLLDFFIHLIQMQIIEEAYPALNAELFYSLQLNDKGCILKLSGYNEKLPLLLKLVTKYFVSFADNLTEGVFRAIRRRLSEIYHNSLSKPSTLAKDARLSILVDNYQAVLDRYNQVSKVTYQEVVDFSREYIKNLYVKMLIQGNVTSTVAESVFNNLLNSMKCEPIPPDSYPKFPVVQLPKGESFCTLQSFNKRDPNSIVTSYYQSETFSLKTSVIIEILMLIIEERLFDTLRTKEQLGYHVYCSVRETYGVLGFTITVNAQATKNTTEFVNSRIDEFVRETTKLIEKKTSLREFEEIKRNLIKIKSVTDVHLKEEANRNWSEIANDDYMFDRPKKEIKAVEQLKLSEVRKWWKDHCDPVAGKNFRKLSVQVVGFDTSKVPSEEVDDTLKEIETDLSLKFLLPTKNTENHIKNIGSFKDGLFRYPPVNKSEC